MAWEWNRILEATGFSANDIIWDGRDLWVTTGQEIRVYSYWSESSQFIGQDGVQSLGLIDTIDLSSQLAVGEVAGYLVKFEDKIYVTNNTADATYEFIWDDFLVIDRESRTYESTLPLGATTSNSKPFVAGEYVWYTSQAQEDDSGTDQQTLYHVDSSGSPISTTIPGRKQFEPYIGGWDIDDYVVLCKHNSVSVLKFNAETGAYVTSITTTRHATSIYVGSDKTILLGGAAGMITSVNTTLNTATDVYGVVDQPNGIIENDDYIWAATDTGMNRLRKSDNDFKYHGGDADAYTLSPTRLAAHAFKKMIKTEAFDAGDGTNVHEHYFMISSTGVYGFNKADMFRENIALQTMGAMISTGAQTWYGD